MSFVADVWALSTVNFCSAFYYPARNKTESDLTLKEWQNRWLTTENNLVVKMANR